MSTSSSAVPSATYQVKANGTSISTSRSREVLNTMVKPAPMGKYLNHTSSAHSELYQTRPTTQASLTKSFKLNSSMSLPLSVSGAPFQRHPNRKSNATSGQMHTPWKVTGTSALRKSFANSTATVVPALGTGTFIGSSGGLTVHPTGTAPFPNRTIVISANTFVTVGTGKPWIFGKSANSSAWFVNTTYTSRRTASMDTVSRRPWILRGTGLGSSWFGNLSLQAQPTASNGVTPLPIAMPSHNTNLPPFIAGLGHNELQPTFPFTARPLLVDNTAAVVAKTSRGLLNVLVVPSPTPGALPIGDGVAQVGANGAVIVGDQTIAPGTATTQIAGAALSVPTGGGAIVVNGATHTFPQITPPPIQGIVAGGITWTPAGPSAIVAGSNTLSEGSTLVVPSPKVQPIPFSGADIPRPDAFSMHGGTDSIIPLAGEAHTPAAFFGGAGGMIALMPDGVVVADGTTGIVRMPGVHSTQPALVIPSPTSPQAQPGLITNGPAAAQPHTASPQQESITTEEKGVNMIADGPGFPDPRPRPHIQMGAIGGGSQNPDPETVQATGGTGNGVDEISPADGAAPSISHGEPVPQVGGSAEVPSNPSDEPSSDQRAPHVSATPDEDPPSSAVHGAPEAHPELDDEGFNESSDTSPGHRRPSSSPTAFSPFVPGPVNPDPEAHVPVSPGEDLVSFQSASPGSPFDATQPEGGLSDIASSATTTNAQQQEDGDRNINVASTADTAVPASPINGSDQEPVAVPLPPNQPAGINGLGEPAPSGVIIASVTHTANFNGHITIGDQILHPEDPPTTIAGTPIAAVNGGVVFGSGPHATIAPFTTLQATEAKPVAAASSSPQPSSQGIILGNDIHPLAENGDLPLADQTLHPNGPPAIISDSTFSLSPLDLVVTPKASDGDTHSITLPILPLLGSPPSKTGASNLYLFSTHYTPNSQGVYLIASQTLAPNGPGITVSGTAVSMASDGLQVGSDFYPRKTWFPPSLSPPHTLAEGTAPTSFATASTTDTPAILPDNSFQTFTGAGQVFTVPDPTATATSTGSDDTLQTPVVEVLGVTITRGAPGKTISGQLISYGIASYSGVSGDGDNGGGGGGGDGDGGNGEIVVMGSSTFSVPASISRFDSSPRGTRRTGTMPSIATGKRKGDDDSAGILSTKRIGDRGWWIWIMAMVLLVDP